MRIHEFGFFGTVAEKSGIEAVYVFECWTGVNVVRLRQQRWFNPSREHFLIAKKGNGLYSIAQVLPELIEVLGSGEAACHADDGDVCRCCSLARSYL